jgi:alanine racemase
VPRSEISIDLEALRRNARTLLRAAGGAELWAVVKADAYGHGSVDCARAALEAGAAALCVTTLGEARELRGALPEPRILVLGPVHDLRAARETRVELVVGHAPIPSGIPVHLKLDTGMGRWGLSELPAPPADVVGVMTHLATADNDQAFARDQIRRFSEATEHLSHLLRHVANSAATLRLPESRFDVVRCGIGLFGVSPFDDDPARDGLEPVLSWTSELAQVKRLPRGASTGYGRRFVAERDTWIGIVPVGYADGFRRDLTGTDVIVEGERRRVVGTISMDAFAVELGRDVAVGTPVVLIGRGLTASDHARVADTIGYEIVAGIAGRPARAERRVRNA